VRLFPESQAASGQERDADARDEQRPPIGCESARSGETRPEISPVRTAGTRLKASCPIGARLLLITRLRCAGCGDLS